jgi:hypothetical protein
MPKRIRANLQFQPAASAAVRPSLFGLPQLLEGEDADAYDELFGRLCAAVKPVDIVDEMFTFDVAQLEWEVLRWRRLKLNLIRARQLEALKSFLHKRLDYDPYSQHFVDYLAKILENLLEEGQANAARILASKYVQGNPDAVDKVDKVLADDDLDIDHLQKAARRHKVEELVQQYARHTPQAITQIHALVADAGLSVDALAAEGLTTLPQYFEYIERIDRLATIAESRRNASLREIDRRRAVLAEALRRGVQEVEDAEFKLVETAPAKEKNTA